MPRHQSRLSTLIARLFASFASIAFANNVRGQDDATSLADLSLDELLAIEVTTAGKIPETIRNTPASIHLVTRTTIEQEGHSNLTEVFENVPGMYNIDNYEGVSGNFGLRGAWNSRSQNSSVAILINGIPQSRMDTYSNPMEMLNLPVEAIDRIEIIRGPNSVIYGNGASFGAINIITNESYFQNQIRFSIGEEGQRRAALRWSTNHSDAHLIINAGKSESDGADPLLRDLMSEEAQAELPSLGVTDPNASLKNRLERSSEYLQISGGWKSLYLDFTGNFADTEFFFGAVPVSEGNLRETNNTRTTVGWKSSFENDTSIDTRVTYGAFEIEQTFDAFTPDFLGINTLEYDSLEIESLFSYIPHPELSFIAGVNWQRMMDLREFTLIPALGLNNEVVEIDERDTQSFFSQASCDFTDRIRATVGFRIEEQPSYDRLGYTNIVANPEPDFGEPLPAVENFTPRISIAYQKSKAEVLKIMAGDAIKLSTYLVDFFRPERIRTVEANYVRSTGNSLCSISLFHNSLNNLIAEELRILPDGSLDTEQRLTGAIKTIGIEALYRAELGSNWTAEVSATWQDSDDQSNPGIEPAYSPKLVAHAKALYKRDRFSAAFFGRFVDKMESFYDVSRLSAQETLGDRIGDASDSYVSLESHFRLESVWQGFDLDLRISNLLDSEIRYPNNPLNSARLDRGNLGPGRRALVSIGKRF